MSNEYSILIRRRPDKPEIYVVVNNTRAEWTASFRTFREAVKYIERLGGTIV